MLLSGWGVTSSVELSVLEVAASSKETSKVLNSNILHAEYIFDAIHVYYFGVGNVKHGF